MSVFKVLSLVKQYFANSVLASFTPITIIFWATPLLLLAPLLDWIAVNILGFVPFEPKVFIHLLGATFVALVVNYQAGVEQIIAHVDVFAAHRAKYGFIWA